MDELNIYGQVDDDDVTMERDRQGDLINRNRNHLSVL